MMSTDPVWPVPPPRRRPVPVQDDTRSAKAQARRRDASRQPHRKRRSRYRRQLRRFRTATLCLLLGCGPPVKPDDHVRELGRDFVNALIDYAVSYGKAYACREMPFIATTLNLCEPA